MKKIEQQNALQQQIYQDLISGTLEPGSAINIDALKRKYQLSTAPIREALKQLLPSGMITFTPNKGFRATDISQQKFKEIYNCRILIEKEALRQAIKQSSDEHKGELLADQFKLARLSDKNINPKKHKDSFIFLETYKKCYLNLFSPIQNSTLFQMINNLYQQSERYRFKILQQAKKPKEWLQQKNKTHKQLVNAIISGKNTIAIKHLYTNLEKTSKTTLENS